MGGFLGTVVTILLFALAVALGMWGYRTFFGGRAAA